VIFLVVGDLLQEEKLVALAVDLCELILGNHICWILFVTSNLISYSGVSNSPHEHLRDDAPASFIIRTQS
jgi:hypothetical protein